MEHIGPKLHYPSSVKCIAYLVLQGIYCTSLIFVGKIYGYLQTIFHPHLGLYKPVVTIDYIFEVMSFY